jgi:hypothetical protein
MTSLRCLVCPTPRRCIFTRAATPRCHVLSSIVEVAEHDSGFAARWKYGTVPGTERLRKALGQLRCRNDVRRDCTSWPRQASPTGTSARWPCRQTKQASRHGRLRGVWLLDRGWSRPWCAAYQLSARARPDGRRRLAIDHPDMSDARLATSERPTRRRRLPPTPLSAPNGVPVPERESPCSHRDPRVAPSGSGDDARSRPRDPWTCRAVRERHPEVGGRSVGQ